MRYKSHFLAYFALYVASAFFIPLAKADLIVQPANIIFSSVTGQPCNTVQTVRIVTDDYAQNPGYTWNGAPDQTWAHLSRSTGPVPGTVDVTVDTTQFTTPGVYPATITISAPGITRSQSVSITLIINDPKVQVARWKDGHKGSLSGSVDDSLPSGFEVFEKNWIRSTYYLNGDTVPAYFNGFVEAGMELGCHLVNHYCDVISSTTLHDNIVPNMNAISRDTPQPFSDVITMAWPCGFTTLPEQSFAAQYFLAARGYNWDQLEDPTPAEFMNLKSFNSHEHSPAPPDDLKTVVDDAETLGKWANLVFHGGLDDDGAMVYSTTKDLWVAPVGSVVKYIQQRDRTIISGYQKSATSIQFGVRRLQLNSGINGSFESSIKAEDTVTLGIDLTGIPGIASVSVDNVAQPFSIRPNPDTQATTLYFNVSPSTDVTPRSVAITFTSASAPTLIVSPNHLSFTTPRDSVATSQQIQIQNGTPSTTMSWTATTDPGSSWLTISGPSQGVNNGTVTLNASALGLAPGRYTTGVNIVAPGVANSPRRVDVALEVTELGAVRYNFIYPDRASFGRDGWDFNGWSNGIPRISENDNFISFDQTTHPGILRFLVQPGDIWMGTDNSINTFLRDLPPNWSSIRLKMDFWPSGDYQQMGLLLYQDDDNYVNLSRISLPIVRDPNSPIFLTTFVGNQTEMVQEIDGGAQIMEIDPFPASSYYYRLDRNSDSQVTGYYSLDGAHWFSAGSVTHSLVNPRLGLFTGEGDPVPYEVDADYYWVEVVVPPTPQTLNITSSPESGLNILASPDNNGQTTGSTPFSRVYSAGRSAILTAPLNSPGGLVFQKWLLDDADYSLNQSITLPVDGDHNLTAVYVSPVTVRTLTLNSVNPNSGVQMTVSPTDRSGTGAGPTRLILTYNDGAQVIVTAPDTAQGNTFVGWIKDGVAITDGRQVTVTMDGDHSLTANYLTPPPVTHLLTVASSDPDTGVSVTVSPNDNNNQGNGTTLFTRTYNDGVKVTLTAPAQVGGSQFLRWEKDGDQYSTTLKTTVRMKDSHTMTAVYVAPQVVRTLTVGSSNPSSGVTVLVSPTDTKGAANGSTLFTRSYSDGAKVTLTAPSTAGGNNFQKWQKDGSDYSSSPSITVKMDASHTFTAVYVTGPPLRTLTVASSNPATGVSAIVFPPDKNKSANGSTLFTRTYGDGMIVFLGVPARVNGNNFQKWQLDGADYGTKPFTIVRMRSDHTLTAVYASGPTTRTLTIASSNPDTGVAITVSPDRTGAGNGSTIFKRTYNDGATVSLNAPSTTSGKTFQKWLLDGTTLSTSPGATLTMDKDHTVTAVYTTAPATQTLTVNSSNPNSGVVISVKSSDPNKASSSPTTSFNQTYTQGTTVTVTAPGTAPNGNTFQKWQLDGKDIATSATTTITMDANHVLTAVYIAPVAGRTLTITSTNPNSGVSIAVLPTDRNGLGNGSTPLSRLYYDGTLAMVMAAPSASGSTFQKWQLDGSDYGTLLVTIVKMDGNHTLTAVYTPPVVRTLSVASSNPGSGVAVTVSPADKNGAGNDSTAFTRSYYNGVSVTLTAPSTAGGNNFQKWQIDGSDLTTSTSATVAMNANHALTAVYVTPPSTAVPSPWATRDIGSVAAAGSASYTGSTSTFTVVGSGNDIWDAKDEFRYVYQSGGSTCTIVARVKSVQNTDPWAKAGVMIRDTLDANARHASLFVTPGNGIAFQARGTTGGFTSNNNATRLSAPYWVKVVRFYNTFTVYYSTDGHSWTQFDSTTIAMGKTVYIGLAVTSHNDGTLCSSVFDNVTATP